MNTQETFDSFRPAPNHFAIEMMARAHLHNQQVESEYLSGADPEEVDEDYNISLPYSDLAGVWVNYEDHSAKTLRAFPLWRLNYVRQLGFLINLGPDRSFDNYIFSSLNHTRVNHMLVAGMVMGKILRRNGFDEQEAQIGELAAEIHDIATPAGGDAVKAIDKAHLDEEDYWPDVVDDEGWAYLESIGTTQEQIDNMIHNRGLMGRLLDIVDRVTYVMQDTNGCMNNVIIPDQKTHVSSFDLGFKQILDQDPTLGDIYKTIFIDKAAEQIYFSDPEKLRRFLELRAVLHRDVYLNWASQGRDMLVGELLRPFYSIEPEEGKLTPHDLRRMGDDELLSFLAEKYGQQKWSNNRHFFHEALENFKPLVETFSSPEDAQKRAEELNGDPDLIVLGTKHVKPFKTGVDYLVLGDNGKVIPFSQHDPVCAARLEAISAATERNFVFYAKATDIPRPLKVA